MAINAEAVPTTTTTYPIALNAPQAGTYTISFEGLASLSNPKWSLYLLDSQTGISTLVTETATYSFTAAQGANNGRFSLVLNPAGVTTLSSTISNKVMLSPNPAASVVTLQLAHAVTKATTFRISNAIGQVVMTVSMPANATELNLDLSTLANGVYIVQATGFGVTKLVKE
jgi:spore germination protein GerM